ncbi:MAG TPA: hypothetical protein VF391_00040 [Dermatophilaceae bacterium]
MGLVEVLGPVRRVVVCGVAVPFAVRQRDLVVQRARRSAGVCRLRRGAEVGQDREDRLLALCVVLDVLRLPALPVLPDVDDTFATLGLDLGRALDELLGGLLLKGTLLLAERALEVVLLLGLCSGRVSVDGSLGGLGGDLQGRDGECANSYARQDAQVASFHEFLLFFWDTP